MVGGVEAWDGQEKIYEFGARTSCCGSPHELSARAFEILPSGHFVSARHSSSYDVLQAL